MRIEGIRTDWALLRPREARIVEAVRRCEREPTRRIEPALASLDCATTLRDQDGDGVPDTFDPDIDGDGIPNTLDRSPYDPAVGHAIRDVSSSGRKRPDAFRSAYLALRNPIGSLLNLLV